MELIDTLDALEALYGLPGETAAVKETDHVTSAYRAYIEAAPFVALATAGPTGLDCSPRGDKPGFVRVVDDKTLMMPDRRGNNRVDSLRNIVRDPRVGLLFLILGVGNALRLNGRAVITADAELCASFAVEDKAPRSVVVITVETVFTQCARAIVRSNLWSPDSHVNPTSLPSVGSILADLSEGRVGGETYDRDWADRSAKTLW